MKGKAGMKELVAEGVAVKLRRGESVDEPHGDALPASVPDTVEQGVADRRADALRVWDALLAADRQAVPVPPLGDGESGALGEVEKVTADDAAAIDEGECVGLIDDALDGEKLGKRDELDAAEKDCAVLSDRVMPLESEPL